MNISIGISALSLIIIIISVLLVLVEEGLRAVGPVPVRIRRKRV